MTESDDSFKWTWKDGRTGDEVNWRNYERVEAPPTQIAALPQVPGTAVTLKYFRQGEGPWLLGETGQPADPQPKWRYEWPGDGQVMFIVEVSGTEARLHGADLWDDRALTKLGNGCGFSRTAQGSPEYRIEIRTAASRYASPRLVEIPLTYGTPETRTLQLEDGQRVRFGDTVEAAFLCKVTGQKLSSGYRDGFRGSSLETILGWGPPWPGTRTTDLVALALWPSGSGPKLEARAPGQESWSGVYGLKGPTTVESLPEGTSSLELRFLPYAARVQFRLPPSSFAPDVADLLDLHFEEVEYENHSSLKTWLSDTLLIRCSQPILDRGNGLAFPMHFQDTTPRAVVEELRDKMQTPMYVDSDSFYLITQQMDLVHRIKQSLQRLRTRLGF